MTRRTWLTASAAGLLASCGRKKGTGYPGYAIVATAGDNSVSAVDLSSFRLARIIPVSAPPSAVVPGESTCFVLTPSNGSISVIDQQLKPVLTRRIADDLSELRFSPDRKRLIALATSQRQIVQLDPATLNVLRRDRVEAAPHDVDVSGTHVAVVVDDAVVELFEWQTGRKTRAQLDGKIGSVRFRADGKLLLASNVANRSIVALQVPELQVLAELPLAMAPQNLCFTEDGGQLFVSGEGMDAVAIVFPYNTLEVEQTVLAGRNPGAMACSGTMLFVANEGGSSINVMNIDSRKVIGLVEVGSGPGFIAVTPDDQYALILDEASGDLAVIHITAIRANRERSGVALFTMLPVGNRPVHCAVLPKRLG